MPACTPALRFVAVSAIALAPVLTLAQGQPPGRGGPAGINRLIVRAINTSGEPVTDLKAEELTVKVDGRDRKVTALEVVTAAAPAAAAPAAPAAPAPATPAAAAPPLPAPFAENAAGPAPAAAPPGTREFLIILDEEGVGPGREQPVRDVVAQLIAQAAPADRFGLISLRVGGVQIAPTTERQAITDAMTKFVGGGSSNETPGSMVCRSKRAFGTFNSVFRSAPVGRTIVTISPGLPATPDGMGKMGRVDSFSTPDLCQIRSADLEELGISANTSPANMYFVYYPEGLASPVNVSIAQEGLENLAGVTGAESVRISTGNTPGVARIARETRAYYLVTLDQAPPTVGRRVEARATRDGLRVLARPATDRAGAAGTASAKGLAPRDMLKTASAFTQVPLRAAAYVSRQGAAEMKVITLFEPADPSIKLTAASVGLIDEKGTLKSQWTAKPEELAGTLIPSALPITPGKYRVRVAASTATGDGGTVDYDLTAGLEDAGALKLVTMMLGFTNEKGGFTPKLLFTSNDKMAVGMVEVYGVTKGANVTVQYELAEAGAATPLGDAPGQIIPGAGDDARIAVGGFGIETLAPGDYVMRAKISLDGKHVGTASRTIRKAK